MNYKKSFASDNNSGVHPEILKAIEAANVGHTFAYGNDKYTSKAKELLEAYFGNNIDVYFMFNGTGANVLALKTLTRSWQSILCSEYAHIYEDECGAPEKNTGSKLIPLKTEQGKFGIQQIAQHLTWLNDEHRVQPRVVSITQSTEFATVYTVDEIKAICDFCHANNLLVHMDGARIANAAVSLGVSFKEFTRDLGVDVVSFGGTKNGMMMGEAVIFFNPELSAEAKYYRKQNMQLNSKMRFVSAQFIAYLENDLWKRNATQANQMAQLLYQKVKDIPGIQVLNQVQSNGIFAIIPKEITPALQQEYFFYVFNEHYNVVRWMCSFDTTEEDVLNFAAAIRKHIGA
ncbi:MAG: low specificity L-threonine aldolase [Flavobacteriales bacterium]|nr:low specificity L-threonine aldolase [Flavobacteriales bacterium]